MTLTTDHLFDVGVDACLELIRTYRDSDIPGNAAVIQMIVPAVMQQAERLGKAMSEGKIFFFFFSLLCSRPFSSLLPFSKSLALFQKVFKKISFHEKKKKLTL